jgi:hypothetical protein
MAYRQSPFVGGQRVSCRAFPGAVVLPEPNWQQLEMQKGQTIEDRHAES